jgi:Kinesin-like protein
MFLGITGNNVQQSMDMTGENSSQNTNNTSNNNGPRKILPKSSVVDEIEKLKQRREERRMRMEEIKREKAEREAENEALGKLGDVEFDAMIEASRFKQPLLQRHTPASNLRLCVCVRKRPIFQKELLNGEIDAVSCANPQIMVHECKYKVDGITKYVENHAFTFDNTFNQDETNYDVYNYSISPHVDFLMNQGIVTCFAYGQTGSGKTYTMVNELGH